MIFDVGPRMKTFALITLLALTVSGVLAAEPSAWKLVKTEPARDKLGYVNFTVQNTSQKPLELVEHWQFENVALANVCILKGNDAGPSKVIAYPPIILPLIAEPCHYPNGGIRFLKVKPGESVRARLPAIGEFNQTRRGLVLTQRTGKVVVGPLPSVADKGQQDAGGKRD